MRIPAIIQAKIWLLRVREESNEEQMKYNESRMMAVKVSVPKMKKMARSEALWRENLPAV